MLDQEVPAIGVVFHDEDHLAFAHVGSLVGGGSVARRGDRPGSFSSSGARGAVPP
jgi:hypothetical protein